jgi:DNA-binding CsgD family transcriptional regulator
MHWCICITRQDLAGGEAANSLRNLRRPAAGTWIAELDYRTSELGENMNARVLESRSRFNTEPGSEVLDALAQSDTPALATDIGGHVVFWNHAAERLIGRPANQVLGRRCYDVLGGRDVFGNRYCHENCSVLSMSRKSEAVKGFEIVLSGTAKPEQAVNVSVLRVPGARPENFILVHLLQPIDRASRLARALESLGARPEGNGSGSGANGQPIAAGPVSLSKVPPLTEREREILRWVAGGLQNKEIAQKLGISLATVRNHIHNILEKLDVHSKLEAVSLAFRQGWVSGPHGELGMSAEPSARS